MEKIGYLVLQIAFGAAVGWGTEVFCGRMPSYGVQWKGAVVGAILLPLAILVLY